MKVFVATVAVLLLIQSTTIGKKHRMKTVMSQRNVLNDAVLEVEPLPPDVMMGQCTCKCCESTPAPLVARKCPNDVVIAIDSSACFRDHHSRMMRFLQKLVRRIGRTDNIRYGGDESRLALMQFSSDIIFPLELSSFENYTNPASSKAIMTEINDRLPTLRFLGEGSFLNKALNATVDHIQGNPRPSNILQLISPKTPRPVVILMTNGKSHPTVTMDDIEYSIEDLESAGVIVLPVSVTRECHGVQSDIWNEGLCPDTVILNKLAKLGNRDSATFMEMNSHDTIPDIINFLQCYNDPAAQTGPSCNNCTCSCELPVGPPGPPGPRGLKGDFVQGDPGEKGDIGPPGRVGVEGAKGEGGDKGAKGDEGPVGPKGDTGDVGSEGKKGEVGDEGKVGPKGEPGFDGGEGPRGEKGDTGDDGEPGPIGGVGEKGEVGEKGNDGEKGDIGEPGPGGETGIGEKGTKGEPGKTGPEAAPGRPGEEGEKGDKGDRGLCGKPGPAGKPGFEGIAGVDGTDGLQGPTGPQGPHGKTGSSGEKGASGEHGTQGPIGLPGLQGARGPEGPQGIRGHKGEKGEPSELSGPPGLPGLPGARGESGEDGADGLEGPQGTNGRQGPKGPPGERGLPGVYDLEELRPIIAEIIRELLPGDCVAEKPADICVEHAIDLAFLVDGSDSIDPRDFDTVKEWILLTIDAFRPLERKKPMYVDVVQYSSISMVEVHALINNSSDEIAKEVRNIEQMFAGTETYSALQFVNEQVFPGMREGSSKILITLTDGQARDVRNVETIEQARENFQLMIAAGVGSEVNTEELADFSTNGNVFSVEDFAQLEGIISQIVENICSKIDSVISGMEEEEVTTESPVEPSSSSSSDDDDDICSEEPPFGDCNPLGDNSTLGKYYWNKYLRRCVLFYYKRCPGGNVFDTASECEERCQSFTTPSTPPPSALPIDPGCHRAITDLAFVMDGSSSVGEDGFAILREFLRDVTNEFQNIGEEGVQVAMIQYNDVPRLEFDFDQAVSKPAVMAGIENLEYMNGNTRTGAALEFLRRTFGSVDEARRPGAKRIAVVITDGRSQDEVLQPSLALKNEGVVVFAVGVGEAEKLELREIASLPSDQYVFSVDDYAAISKIQESLVSKICREARGYFEGGTNLEDENLIEVDDGSIGDDDEYTEYFSGEREN